MISRSSPFVPSAVERHAPGGPRLTGARHGRIRDYGRAFVRRLRVTALAAALLALAPAPALAQAVAAPAAPAVDPARLALARQLIDRIMPPADREKMIEAMLVPVMANVSRTLKQDPKLAETLGKHPRVKAIFDRFIDRQTGRSMANLRGELPAMAEAMSRAYARNFDLSQLREIAAFFATPTGAVYLARSPAIMKDPDVLAWQSALMVKSLATMQTDVTDMLNEISAEAGSPL